MSNNSTNQSKENISSFKILWQSLPLNIKRFAIVVFIVLIFSAFFTIYYFSDAVGELIWMSQQIDNSTK